MLSKIRIVLVGLCIFLFGIHSLSYAESTDEMNSNEDFQSILDNAMDRIREDYTEKFSFREEVSRGGESVVGEYDPSRGEQAWTLLSVDDAKPSKEKSKDYLKQKRKQAENLEKHPERSPMGVKAMVERGSLKLIENQTERWVLSFTPTGEDQKMMRRMKGELAIRKSGRFVEWVDVRSEKPFKPNLVTKMKEFIMHYEFKSLPIEDRVVPTSFEFRISLSAVGIIDVDEHLFARYSNYRVVN